VHSDRLFSYNYRKWLKIQRNKTKAHGCRYINHGNFQLTFVWYVLISRSRYEPTRLCYALGVAIISMQFAHGFVNSFLSCLFDLWNFFGWLSASLAKCMRNRPIFFGRIWRISWSNMILSFLRGYNGAIYKTRNGEWVTRYNNSKTAVYGYNSAPFWVLSVSCWCLAKLIST